MTPETTFLERVSVRTPLGLRFWDPVTDRPVSSGLEVTAARADRSGPVSRAVMTTSGFFAFHHLAGLREWERPEFASLPESPEGFIDYEITVNATSGVFLPMRFRVTAPRTRVFPDPDASPPESPAPGVYLLSSPKRLVDSSTARIRADVFDVVNDRPAAHALVEVSIATQLWYGMADRAGRAAVYFPYPSPEMMEGSSPPLAPALAMQTWPVTVRVFYSSFTDAGAVADLDAVRAQPEAVIADAATSPPASPSVLSEHLEFRRELVLRTGEASTLDILPVD